VINAREKQTETRLAKTIMAALWRRKQLYKNASRNYYGTEKNIQIYR